MAVAKQNRRQPVQSRARFINIPWAGLQKNEVISPARQGEVAQALHLVQQRKFGLYLFLIKCNLDNAQMHLNLGGRGSEVYDRRKN